MLLRFLITRAANIYAGCFLSQELKSIRSLCTGYVYSARLYGGAPSSLMKTFILAEDRRFFDHFGFDCRGIARALYMYLKGGRLSGASTIDQQLVRTLRARYERSLSRKISEIMLSIALQRHFSKSQILQCYLEVAYFGWRMNGYRQAIKRLGMVERDLTLKQASQITAMLKYPLPRKPSDFRLQQIEVRQRYIQKIVSKGNSVPQCIENDSSSF